MPCKPAAAGATISPPQPTNSMQTLHIRRASGGEDACGIARLMAGVVAERIHSAIDCAWTAEEQLRYLQALSPRQAVHIAVNSGNLIIAAQTLDLWSPLPSMRHVAQLGTFVAPEWRGRGVGRQLWKVTEAFAQSAGYRKLVIQVRGSNTRAHAFYTSLGFQQCGLLQRQVILDGKEDDEILMELFL